MHPGERFGGLILVDQPPDEGAQDTGSHARLHVGKGCRVKFEGGMKADASRIIRGGGRFEYPVDDATIELDVLIQV